MMSLCASFAIVKVGMIGLDTRSYTMKNLMFAATALLTAFGVSAEEWQFFSAKAAPAAATGEAGSDGSVDIRLPSNYAVGWWIRKFPCERGKAMRFRAEAETVLTSGECAGNDVSFCVNWLAPRSRYEFQTDYLNPVENFCGGKTTYRFDETICVPSNCTEVTIQPVMRWRAGRTVFKNFSVETVAIPPPRIARVAITNPRRGRKFISIESRLQQVEAALTNLFANVAHPDIVLACSEVFAESLAPCTVAEPADSGPTFQLLSRYAARYNCWMAGGLREVTKDGLTYNSAVLVDRKGRFVGTYRKTHLTYGEILDGTMPGDSYPVFETDFGKVGFLICWDNFFPEAIRQLHLNGAELVLYPIAATSQDRIDKVFATRSYDTGLPIAVAIRQGPRPSRIIGHDTSTLAEVTEENGFCYADIDLSHRDRVKWLSVNGMGAAYQLYRAERRPSTYTK